MKIDKYEWMESAGYVIMILAALALALTYWVTSLANPDMTSMRILINNKGIYFWGTVAIFAGGILSRYGYNRKGRNHG